MHSKLIRLQTALLTLALLFTVLVPVSAYAEGETTAAQGTADGTTISDPNTFNAWEYTQAYNNATTGRIWADKTVEEEQIDLKGQDPIAVPTDKGADFLVALSALSSHASTTTTNTQALDIVMVLDASGSMDDPMGGGDRTKRMDALKAAVNNFITKAAEQNANITDKEKQIQLSIVKFAGKSKGTIGNDTYRDGRYTYNYSQIVKDLTVCDTAGAAALKNAVNSIDPAGATRADLGLKHAQTVLKNPRPNAKQVVIFFTDGSPNASNGFDDDVASDAIEAAKSLKDAGAVVYTVGIFDGANPDADVSKTSSENKFMQAVSSNYPLATYTWTSTDLLGLFGSWNWNFGTKPANANYYMAASSAEGLKNVFADIFTSVSTTPAGPTQVTDKPETDGYVTFDDPLGDYMEVKSFEAVAFPTRSLRSRA
ncbi:vWA domain-containing protein [Gemmiger formicilis]|uniref:vWA domain-containing protein n=1 Tax=Gemmiger formicilis TaxID=745368 RepID=UPI003079FEE7